jgi:GNAT superfamily N-acetyltransferase
MIRTANNNDIPALIDSLYQLIAHVQTSSKDVYMADIEKPGAEELQSLFAQALDDDNSQVLVVEDDATYAGFILGRITTPFIPLTTIKNIGLIEMCWVETAHRNKGKARQLSQSIEAWFKEKHIKYVDLHYLVGNAEAELSWSKLGYAPFRVTARKELA